MTMTEERRSARRARIAGVRVTYESATGERVETDARDLARGGLFVRTSNPLSIGKRISLEIQIIGEPGPWSALGRVVWIRENGGQDLPAGMGVKLIDVEDTVVATIDRLVETRERTEPGVGEPPNVVADPQQESAAGDEAAAQMAEAPAPPREVSIPIDLMARRREPSPPRSAVAPARTETKKRGAVGWLLALGGIAAVAGVAAYVLFDGMLRPPPRVAPIPASSAPIVSAAPRGELAPAPLSAPETVSRSPAAASPAPTASMSTAVPKQGASVQPTQTAPGRTPPASPKRTDNPY